MKKIAFIGLGNMGIQMAGNLIEANVELKVYDIVNQAMDILEKKGATKASSIKEAVKDVDYVITMLPSGKEVRDVYLGDEGIIENAGSNTLLIDSSTIDVQTSRMVFDTAQKAGKEMIDAPVSGGIAGAKSGTLTFMVGGNEDAFKKAKEILQILGKKIIYTGSSGCGQAAKICNNMILGITMIGVSEAFALAKSLKLDSKKLFDVASNASGQCWSLTSYCPEPGLLDNTPSNNNFKAGFTTKMMLKDLRLSQETAQEFGVATPLGAEATALYTLFNNSGNAEVDFSGIIKMIKGIN